VFRELDDTHGLARALLAEGWAAPVVGDLARGLEAHHESVEQFRKVGDENWIIVALAGLGNTALLMRDLDAAASFNTEALALARKLGDTHSQAQVVESLGLLALEQGDATRATALFKDSIDLSLSVGSLELVCYCLVGLAAVAVGTGALERSAQLFGAAQGLRDRAGLGPWPARLEIEGRYIADLRQAFGDRQDALTRAWEAGRALSLQGAADLARGSDDGLSLRVESAPPPRVPLETADGSPLTARELEVAALIAAGKTSKEIAEALVITERTADTHAAHIRDKLGLRSRAEIAAWVVRQGLTPTTR